LTEEHNQTTEDQEYEERAKHFVGDLDTKLNDEDIKVALAIIIDPKSSRPILYARGSTYQLTRLSCDIAKHFKSMLNKELET